MKNTALNIIFKFRHSNPHLQGLAKWICPYKTFAMHFPILFPSVESWGHQQPSLPFSQGFPHHAHSPGPLFSPRAINPCPSDATLRLISRQAVWIRSGNNSGQRNDDFCSLLIALPLVSEKHNLLVKFIPIGCILVFIYFKMRLVSMYGFCTGILLSFFFQRRYLPAPEMQIFMSVNVTNVCLSKSMISSTTDVVHSC